MEHEVQIVSGKVAADHVHMFVSYRPQLALSKLAQYLKGVVQEFYYRSMLVSENNCGEDIYGQEGTWLLVREILRMN